jgi:hypothetical protein
MAERCEEGQYKLSVVNMLITKPPAKNLDFMRVQMGCGGLGGVWKSVNG